MSSVVILIIDVCIVMLLIGIVNVIFLNVSAIFLLIPLLILGAIFAVWLIRKIQWRDDDDSDDSKKD